MSLKKLTITKHLWTIAAFFLMSSCHQNTPGEILNRQPYVIVLGIAQDAGYPQIGCKKSCCEDVWSDPTKREKEVVLGWWIQVLNPFGFLTQHLILKINTRHLQI